MSPPLDDGRRTAEEWLREIADTHRIPAGTRRLDDAPAGGADAPDAIPLEPQPFVWMDPSAIPPREWLLGTTAIRKFITLLVAAGGAGKSTLSIAWALSIASGRSLTGEHVFERAGAWIFNLEDPLEEMQRRVTAAILHHKLRPADLAGRLFVNSGRDRPLVIAKRSEDNTIVFPDKDALTAAAKRCGIGIIVVDPFIACHKLDENSNNDMEEATTAWKQVAHDANCSVVLVHHTRKTGPGGNGGDIESSRGGKSLSDAARVGLTLSTMPEEDAKKLGVPVEKRRFFVRMDDAKANLTPPSSEAVWFQLHSVALNNTTEKYPNGDHVQAIGRWRPPSLLADVEREAINRCLDAIEAGLGDGRLFGASSRGGSERYVGPVIEDLLDKNADQAKAILSEWMRNGLLVEEEFHNPKTRRDAKGLRVDNSKRPS